MIYPLDLDRFREVGYSLFFSLGAHFLAVQRGSHCLRQLISLKLNYLFFKLLFSDLPHN